jgi:hypothetical protein
MKLRIVLSALLAAGIAASVAAADAPAPAPAPTATAPAGAPNPGMGPKEWKERINLVARKPYRHDINWLDSHDRSSWRTFTTWQGVRDERPLIARKVMGFHEPRPHATHAQRVETLSRGPLRGPAPAH